MKKTLIACALISSTAFAQEIPWKETFKIPEGITYRARTSGFDCGTFTTNYVATPAVFAAAQVQYRQLAADKDLNIFLIEATYPSTNGAACYYGIYLDRNRDDKTLDFNRSEVISEGALEDCQAGKEVIDHQMQKVAYEASKRGIRYIATQVISGENEVCENGVVRVVFDRRYE